MSKDKKITVKKVAAHELAVDEHITFAGRTYRVIKNATPYYGGNDRRHITLRPARLESSTAEDVTVFLPNMVKLKIYLNK